MKLRDLEEDIKIMEETVAKMESLNKEVVDMEVQVDHVRHDLVEELHQMEENALKATRDRPVSTRVKQSWQSPPGNTVLSRGTAFIQRSNGLTGRWRPARQVVLRQGPGQHQATVP